MPTRIKHTTINDIAELAGVTNTTVSRVFTVPEKVKPSTREKILKIAQTLNYVPNALAQTIKNDKSRIIGVVTDDTFNPVYAQVIKRLCELGEAANYSVMIFTTHGCPLSEARAMRTLSSWKVAGIILSVVDDGAGYDTRHINAVLQMNIPIIQLDREFDPNHPGVFIDNVQSGRLLGERIARHQRRRLLVLGVKPTSNIVQQRLAGLKQKLNPDTVVTLINTEFDYERARTTLHDWFNHYDADFDAIVGLNCQITLAALSSLPAGRLEGVRVYTFDTLPYADEYGIRYTAVVHAYDEWAKLTCEAMFNAIDNLDYDLRTFIPGQLIDRYDEIE